MRTLGRLFGSAVLVAVGLDCDLSAQERERDLLFVTAEGDSGAALTGGGGEAEWLHWISPRSGVSVGGASMSLSQLSWTYGTIGGLTRRGVFTLAGRASVGAGRSGAGAFGYGRYLGTASMPVGSGFHIEAEGQLARLGSASTTVLKVGGLYAGAKRASLRMAYLSAWSSVVHAQAVSARGELTVGRLGVLGGVTATATVSRPPELRAIAVVTNAVGDFFGGVSMATTKGSQVMCVLEIAPQPTPGERLVRVIGTLRLPLGARHGPSRKASDER